ncbi:4-hydroxy-tetrahydrodipicolinate reductase [Sinomicrobium sp.]
MKIALLGYGKMGKMIEQIALSRNHEITAKIDDAFNPDAIKGVDVAIDFSIPSAAFNNITGCFELGIPVISGTTGWLDRYDEAVKRCQESDGAFIYASNFSLGVNIFFQLNEYLARMMANLADYKVSMEEIHHTQKLDAPSGTAITLAEGIIRNTSKTGWKLDHAGENEIPITAKRIDSVPGTHSIKYSGKVDDIEIVHTAHSREGFALGAVIAAEWIRGKTGVFTMKDVLNLQ